jgi:hypothetical protein
MIQAISLIWNSLLRSILVARCSLAAQWTHSSPTMARNHSKTKLQLLKLSNASKQNLIAAKKCLSDTLDDYSLPDTGVPPAPTNAEIPLCLAHGRLDFLRPPVHGVDRDSLPALNSRAKLLVPAPYTTEPSQQPLLASKLLKIPPFCQGIHIANA